jgi:hypothetical protein
MIPLHNNIVTKLEFILNIDFHVQLFFFVQWPSIVDFCDRTLPRANLSVPKFLTFSWQVQKRAQKKPLTLALSKDLINLIDETHIWEVIIQSFLS